MSYRPIFPRDGRHETPSKPESQPPRWHRLEDMDPEPPRRRRAGLLRIVVILVAVATLGVALALLGDFPE